MSEASQAKAALFPIDFLIILVFAAILRLPYLSIARFGDPDESWYILGARELLLGHLPYTTYWEIKPLGPFVLLSLPMAVFGQSVEVVRLFGMVCVISTACLLYVITRLIYSSNRVPLAAALFYLAFTVALPGTSTMTEILLAPFTTAGVLLLARATERDWGPRVMLIFAAAGLTFGIATWIKYVPAIPAVLTACVAVLAIWRRFGFPISNALSAAAIFVVALLVPTIASIAFYTWMGALNLFLGANFGFAGHYLGDMQANRVSKVFDAIRNTTLAVQDIWPLLLITASACLPTARRHLFAPGRAHLGTILVVWLIGEVFGLSLEGKFYDYQWLLVLPPLCVLSAVAVGAYSSALARPSKAALVTMLAAVFLIIGPAVVHLRSVAAELSRPDVPRQIARVILSDAKPGDSLFVVNYEVIIYLLAKMPLPSRFTEPFNLLGAGEVLIPEDPHAEVRRILGTDPKYIVFNTSWRDSGIYWDPDMMALVEATLSRDYIERESWIVPGGIGTVALFVRSE